VTPDEAGSQGENGSGHLSGPGDREDAALPPRFATAGHWLVASLSAPPGVDFDLYLEHEQTPESWVKVASDTGPEAGARIQARALADGRYRWSVHAYRGAGTFQLEEAPGAVILPWRELLFTD